jgi:hypothetical protein
MTYDQTIDLIFDFCVRLLIDAGALLGMSYEEINIWLFIVFEPLLFLAVVAYAWSMRGKVKKMKLHLLEQNQSPKE